MHKALLVASMGFLFSPHTSYAKTIIWDLGGVLFEPSTYALLSHMGFVSLAKHVMYDRRYPDIKLLILNLLHNLELDCLEHVKQQYTSPIYDHASTPLPLCMYAWLTGTLTGPELVQHAHARIEQLHVQQYFVSAHEKQLVKNAIAAVFTPASFAAIMRPIQEGLQLVKKCSRVPNNRLILLSNWDRLSFDILAQSPHGAEVLMHFKPEHQVISGNLGYAKPDPRCFEYILTQYNLDPQDCIFIDDQEENCKQAQNCGLTSIWLRNKNYPELERLLRFHNVF